MSRLLVFLVVVLGGVGVYDVICSHSSAPAPNEPVAQNTPSSAPTTYTPNMPEPVAVPAVKAPPPPAPKAPTPEAHPATPAKTKEEPKPAPVKEPTPAEKPAEKTPAVKEPAVAGPNKLMPKGGFSIPALPDVDGVYGGKVLFAAKAFPIATDHKDSDLQGLLGTTRPKPCSNCRASGSVTKKEQYMPPGNAFSKIPTTIAWDETCPVCAGYTNTLDANFGKRLVILVDHLSHVPRDDNFATLAKLSEEHLHYAFEARQKEWPTWKCIDVEEWQYVDVLDARLQRHTERVLGWVKRKVSDKPKHFQMDVGAMLTPLWAKASMEPPTGQAVVLLGQPSDKAEAGGWVWMRMAVQQPQTATGTAPVARNAILLCGTPMTSAVPIGRAAVGGLYVGTWTKGDDPASDPDALPVVMATVSAAQ